MKNVLLFSFLLGMTSLFANQIDSTTIKAVKNLQAQIDKQQIDIQNLYTELDKEYRTYRNVKEELSLTSITIDNQKKVIDSLDKLIAISKAEFAAIQTEINKKIDESNDTTTSKITDLDSSISKNQLYWISGLAILFLAGLIVYWLLGRRMRSNTDEIENKIQASKKDFETQINTSKKSIDEESVKLDTKLVEVLAKQLSLLKVDSAQNESSKEEDHSLVLKVADRLTAMETNHQRMDPKTRGLKQLVRQVRSIKENYKASGYEIVEMVGQEYKEGLNVTANFIPSDKIETGKRIITRIIKPQVNYKGKMIQAAQIEVSVGE